MNLNDVPVLLIGLGGIGTSIVDEAYGKLKAEGRLNFLEAMAFDTDQGELNKLKNIPKDCLVQTSTDKTVKYVLDRDENAKSWFPIHSRILTMPLINGAGQIRAVSRLALRAAMKDGRFNKVQTIKDRLYKLGGNASEKGVRIMIVSSMMGGTGSGMFLQVPLYLREVMQSKFSADRIEIQGTFLLPDVLKGSIDIKKKVNVYANAYAAMKELNAINMSLAGDSDVVYLEYRPDQIDEMKDIAIKEWPYDYCYIYDKEDSKGRVLASLDEYKKLVAENLYSQVYGPISDNLYSHFINEVRSIIRTNCRNIFGGIGIGKLIYPYDDICEYITCKAVIENLDNHLLLIDEEYKNQLEQYNQNKQNGADVEKPDLLKSFIDSFDQHIKDENGEEVGNLFEEYTTYLDETIENAKNDFIEKMGLGRPNASSYEKSVEGQLRSMVDRDEQAYIDYRRAVDSRLDGMAETKAKMDFKYFDEKAESDFDKFLKKDGSYINPVAIRYMLYKIKECFNERMPEVSDDIEDTLVQIEKKEKEKLKGFSKNVNDLSAAIKHAIDADKNPADKFTFKTMKRFKDEYIDQSKKHFNLLVDYTGFVFERAYYRKTNEMVSKLIEEYEGMFARLEDQKVGINKKILELAEKHENNLGKTNIYVLGNKEFKEKIWNSIPTVTKLNTMSNVLPEKMHENLRANCKLKLRNELVNVVGYDYLFNTYILDGCKNSIKNDEGIKDLIDLNIVEALCKEYEFTKEMEDYSNVKDEKTYINEKLREIADRTEPFAPNSDDASNYSIWGINDNLRLKTESSTENPMIVNIITDMPDDAKRICSDKIYSKYEITYVHSRYGLLVSDFAKFYSGKKAGTTEGEYHKDYMKIVADVTDDNRGVGRNIEITPHIDKSWHKILPELDNLENEDILKEQSIAFVLGLANEYIVVEKTKISDDKIRTVYKEKVTSKTPVSFKVTENGEQTPVQGNLLKLYEGLLRNKKIVDEIVHALKNGIKDIEEDTDINNNDEVIYNDKIILSLTNTSIVGNNDISSILDLFIQLYNDCSREGDDKRVKIFEKLYEALFEVINNVVVAYIGSDKDIINDKTKKILEKIIANSNLLKQIDNTSAVYNATVVPMRERIKNIEG